LTISEGALPAGWQFTGIECTGDTDGGNIITGPFATIDLDAAETQTCVFVNTAVTVPSPTPTPSPTPRQPVVWVGDITEDEDDAGTKLYNFVVTIDRVPLPSEPISINWTTLDGTATVADNDYTAQSGVINFAWNTPTLVNIQIPIKGDRTFEHNETFRIYYFNAVNAFLPNIYSLGTIYNDDIPPVYSVSDASVAEGNTGTTPMSFTITRAGNLTNVPAVITFNSINGTAASPSDFVPVVGASVVIQPNETSKTFSVSVNGDTTVEPNENFTLRMSQVAHGTIGRGDGIGTIVNDDSITAGGIEGDIVDGAGSPVGDGTVFSNDVSVIRKMVLGLIPQAVTTPNQFQRADVAPRDTATGVIGDGVLNAADVTLIRQYALGFLPQTTAGGPGVPAPAARPVPASSDAGTISALSASADPGSRVTVSLLLDSRGSESSAAYTLNFDPKVFTYVSSSLGDGVPAGSYLGVNSTEEGRLRLLIDSTNSYERGSRQMATITFDVSPDAAAGEYPLGFNRSAGAGSVSSSNGDLIAANFEDGVITVGSKDRKMVVRGRVLDSAGRGVPHADVILTDQNGRKRTVQTGSFGNYAFTDIDTDSSCVIGVSKRRYRFTPQTFRAGDKEIDIIAME
jgi:Calx-beta domain/Cohesin domain/Carboxypeptidase regulatory-like domain